MKNKKNKTIKSCGESPTRRGRPAQTSALVSGTIRVRHIWGTRIRTYVIDRKKNSKYHLNLFFYVVIFA